MLIPVILLVLALVAKTKPNNEINRTFGFRTKKSMSSQENWDKAQELMTKYFFIIGVAEVIISAIAGYFIVTKFDNTTMMLMVYSILMVLQVLAIVIVIPLVESQLK